MRVGNIEDSCGATELTAGQHAEALLDRIIAELRELGVPGWRHVDAAFALTVTNESARVVFTYPHRVVRVEVPTAVLELVRQQRAAVARTSAGPWWRLTMLVDPAGAATYDYDYGDEPFPADQLFRPEAYRADVAAHPRARLPVWLAGYLKHDGRQSRSARRAEVASRADRLAGIRPQPVDAELPSFPRLWARWATIAAAHVAVGSGAGPRIVPGTGWFESSVLGSSSGSTLYRLPDGRAVLSGGVWNAPALNAAYNGGVDLPNLYAGAPDWVTNAALSPRAAVGLLSFCFWWDGECWSRGESPSVQHCGVAMPGIWSTGTVIATVTRLLSEESDIRLRAAVARLQSGAERGEITPEMVSAAFGADRDVDAALRQLTCAEVVAPRSGRADITNAEFALVSHPGRLTFMR